MARWKGLGGTAEAAIWLTFHLTNLSLLSFVPLYLESNDFV